MTRNGDIEASQRLKAASAPAMPHTDAVAKAHERMPATSSVRARRMDAGPGQQIAREMARRWLAQANMHDAPPPELASAEQAEIEQLKAQIQRLREDNEILKAATVLFAGKLDPRNH